MEECNNDLVECILIGIISSIADYAVYSCNENKLLGYTNSVKQMDYDTGGRYDGHDHIKLKPIKIDESAWD